MKIKYILMLLAITTFHSLFAQNSNLTVGGLVMDENGEELIGASIFLKENTATGVTTDMDGRFKLLNVSSGSTIIVSYIGYEAQEFLITKTDERMRIVLKEIVNEKEEVVIVGRGSQRKVSVTGAITTVDPKDLQVPAVSVTNMLGGRVPGIVAVTRSGEPGNDFSEFWVRGISTFGANSSALVLIDGIEGNLNDLDPADIESFSVLKDASATAVYGVRGANGVVVVTTKRGKAGALSVFVKSNVSISHSPRMPEYVDGVTYAELANEASIVRGGKTLYSDVALSLFRSGLDQDLYPNVNWRDVILRDYSWNHQHHLSASGGGQNARYYLSLGIQNKEAIFKQDQNVNKYKTNVDYKKYNFRANVDVDLTSSTKLFLGLETVIVTQNSPGYGDDNKALWSVQSNLTPVTTPIIYSTGEYAGYGTNSDEYNPYVLMNLAGYKNFYRNTNNLQARLTQDLSMITEGWNVSALFSLNSNSSLWQYRRKMPALYYASSRNRDGSLNSQKTVESSELGYANATEVDRTYYFEVTSNYERVFNYDHRITGLVHFYTQDFSTSKYYDLYASIPKRYMAVSGRITYSYKDTYMIEGNIGYTGSEAFKKGERFGTFPAISVGWVPTQYDLVKDAVPFLDFFKVRGSLGLVGNDRLTNDDTVRFPYLTTMKYTGSNSNLWGNGYGITEDQVGTDNLSWEKAKKYNLGFDAQFLNNRFDFTIDIYKDIRSGIFQERQDIPQEIGLSSSPWANVGKLKSWGYDGNISYTQPFNNNTYLTVRANLTKWDNKVLDFEESGIYYPYMSRIGYNSGVNRGLVALGLFKDEEDVANSPKQFGLNNVLPGDIKYKDVNGDGVIDEYDIVPLQYGTTPQIQYGFATEFNWKNWNFSIFFEGASKVSFFQGGTGYYPFAWGATGNVLTSVANQKNRWTPASYSQDASTENPNAKFPRLTYGANDNNNRASSFWLANGRYLRLKNAQVSYTLKHEKFKKIGLRNATITLYGDNLWLWDKVDNFDPTQASENGAEYPVQRVYTLQVSLQF